MTPHQAPPPATEDTLHPVQKVGLTVAGRLRAYFFAGILITAPIALTLYLAWLFIDYIDDKVAHLLPEKYNPETYLPFAIPGLGLVILAVFLTLVGALTANFIGRYVHRFFERLLARMPVVRSIYGATKQIFETVFAQKSNAFREAVLVEYPRRGIWTVAFVTGRTGGEIADVSADELVTVFIPTTPNPTSGFLLFLPRKDVAPLSMTVEEAIKMVVSGGIVTPPDRRPLGKRQAPAIAEPRGVDLVSDDGGAPASRPMSRP
jgi:uncharacterized membrane protein